MRISFGVPKLFGFSKKRLYTDYCGYCDDVKKVIWVSLLKGHPLGNYIHECLHVRHPSWSESRVRRETTIWLRKMNQRQRLYHYRKMFAKAKRR